MCSYCNSLLASIGRSIVNKGCSAPPFLAMRERMVPMASGDVLEIGVGSGHNLGFYDRWNTRTLVCVDPDLRMLAMARRRADDLQRDVRLLEGSAEDLPIETASVDTAVVSYVLCTVTDPDKVLSEIRRVLRPEGRLIFLEHAAGQGRLLSRIQKRLNAVWRTVAGGCNLIRDPVATLVRNGFAVDVHEDGDFKGRMRFLGRHVAGVATQIR